MTTPRSTGSTLPGSIDGDAVAAIIGDLLTVRRRARPVAGSAEISRLESEVQPLLDEDRSPLPETADLDRISVWAIDTQRGRWCW